MSAVSRGLALNPNCDGVSCTSVTGEVRRYLRWRFCRACWERENERRQEMARRTGNRTAYLTCEWEEARPS